ncbi:hypothetical protein GCM10025856_09390 [Methylophaga marina]|nr:hypothetical protein GCM10025856_09390 [Methylophaga marina]
MSAETDVPLFGLAPGGVYHATSVTRSAVRSYRTLSPLPNCFGGILSVALAVGSRPQVLPGTLPFGARTFLTDITISAIAKSSQCAILPKG